MQIEIFWDFQLHINDKFSSIFDLSGFVTILTIFSPQILDGYSELMQEN